MKSESLQNFISTTVCVRSGDLENGLVAGDSRGKFYRCEVAPAGPAYNSETDVVVKSGKSRRQIYLDGDLAKRKYEDMTSSRIEDVDAGNDHEVSLKLSHFREQMKRRPPEAGNLIQVQGTTVQVEGRAFGEDEFQAGRSDNTRRSCSASGVLEVTPEICGESDLTAENHMAEDSSRSSNNDGTSIFESAAESVSKGSTKELRSVSSLGVMHCFMVHTNGGRDISMVTSSEGPRHMSSFLVKNDGHNITRTEIMKEVKDREGVLKSEQAATSNQLRSGSSEVPASVNTGPSQFWGRSNKEWLQLGVGSSEGINSNAQTEPISGDEGKPSSVGQGHQERAFFKRKITTQIDFPIAADCEPDSDIFPENVNLAPGEWQLRRGSNVIPPKCEAPSDPPVNLNPATFRSEPISGLLKNAVVPDAADVEKPDLCIFGRRLIQTGTARQELVLAPLKGSATRQSRSNAAEKDKSTASIDSLFEMRRDQDDLQNELFPDRDQRFGNAGMRRSEIHNRPGPPFSSMSNPIVDAQVRTARAVAAGTSMDQDPFQCHWDNPPSSLSALQQRREDLRHGQVGYSWLPPPASESAPKLVPMASNFQGWTPSELPSISTKSATLSASAMENPLDRQAMRGSDEWGTLYRKVSPQMIFPSLGQCHLPEGSGSVLVPGLVQSEGQEKNVGSQENLVALKRAIENIKSPQWPIAPEAMNLSVASWCLNGNVQGVRGDSKLQCFAGEQSLMSSMLSESGPVHSRFPGDHLNISENPPKRQSWQPAAGHKKLHHGNVNALQRPPPETAAKPKFEVLPPAPKGTNHAGLWFILQSAESQNSEGHLPQISKAYLRIKDGKMPVSAVKKYLVTKLGLTNESEVEITCKGQPVVPSLPLQHVRDVIWFSSLNANNGNNKEQTSSGEREESTTSASEHRSRPPSGADRPTPAAGMFSKDILMVLTYRRHPRALQGSTFLT